jgi:pimeloyl-ACP methyl ester carboxylesterase
MAGMTNLVMIPAFGCDEGLYAPLLPLLPANVLASTVIADGDDFAICVEQVLARAPERFVILGTSFGGRVAMETALAAPERVMGLVVIGSSAGPVADPRAGARRSERLRAGEAAQVAAEMGDIITDMDGPNGAAARQAFIGMCASIGPEVMTRQSDALAKRGDLRARLAGLSCPALMLWGAHDRFSPAADGLAMAAAMPRGRFVEIAACGHLPSLEYPEETVAAIAHWMQDMGLAPVT